MNAAAIDVARAWLERKRTDNGDCRLCGSPAGVSHEPTDPCGIVAGLLTAQQQMSEAFEVLWATLVPFNERKQELFCRVCRYRDPLVDGTKLHDDNCPLLALAKAFEVIA